MDDNMDGPMIAQVSAYVKLCIIKCFNQYIATVFGICRWALMMHVTCLNSFVLPSREYEYIQPAMFLLLLYITQNFDGRQMLRLAIDLSKFSHCSFICVFPMKTATINSSNLYSPKLRECSINQILSDFSTIKALSGIKCNIYPIF